MPLKEARMEKGLTQLQLAEQSGVKLGTIRKYESGEHNINMAYAEIVCKLAETLDCRAEDLLNKK